MGDQTEDIAYAKASNKVRGPLMDTCTACGERYWPEDKEDHLANHCFPREVHLAPHYPEPKWRLMKKKKKSTLTPAKRAELGLFPKPKRRRFRKSRNNAKR